MADDSGTAYGAGASYPANAATTTLYAIWNPVITYKPNGASGSDHEQVKTYGTTATLKASDTYSRTGFAFKEWNTNQSGTGTPYAAGASYTSNAATTLYAIWNATLSYDANEGIGAPGSQTAKATEEITISETVPTRPGYTFLGWGTSAGASAASYQPGDAYAASGGSIVLYAVWRCDIRLADVTCSLVDANGNDDPLGRYVKASVSYDATTSGHGLSRIAMTLNHSGVDDYLEKTSSLGLEGTETFTFGPYAYDLFDPHGGYHIGRIDAENADGTISASVDLDATSYKNPVIRALSTFRTENVGGVYEASDDGTSLGIEVSYTVSSSRTQSAPRSIAVTVKNSSGTVVATRTFSNISGASGVARLDVYHDSSFPSDILVNGELISAEDSYGVTVVVSDAYSDVVTDAKARSTDTVTIAYFTMDFLGDAHLYNPTEDTQVEIGKVYYTRSGSGTFESPYVYTAVANPVAADLTAYYEANGAQPGHGIGIGKPSTREGLDVGMEAFFDQDVHGSGEVSATDSGNVVHNLTEKANTSDLGDLAFKDTASASDIPAINGITDFSTYVYSAQESRAANTVLAAPNGSAGTASFRALVAADIPDLSGTYVKRQPASATDLPQDTSTSSGYPLVLSDSFANSGVVSYMTAANFRTLINAPSLSESNQYQNCTQFVKFTGVDSSKSNNDISSNISRGWEMLDKNDKYISYLETTANTDGSIQLSLVARNLGTGSNVNNGLYIKVANDGTRSVSVSEAAPWRSGLAVCGVKTVSKTTSSFTSYHTTTTITAPASGWTCIGFVRCCSNGDVDTPYVDSWSQSGTTVTASIWRATTASITVTLTALFVNQSL